MIEASTLVTLPVLGALGAGVLIGLIGGALPGINGITTLTLLLPFVLPLDPAAALTLLLAAHSVVYTGGAVTAIAIAIPGTPPNAAALEDGHRLARLGLAVRAISVAAAASGAGGLLGFLVLLAAIPLALPILKTVGAPEIFVAALAGLLCVARIGAASFEKGLIPALLGIFLGSVGYQNASGVPRLWFDQTQLLDGIGLIPLIMGLFAGPELARLAKLRPHEEATPRSRYFEQVAQGVRDVVTRPSLVLKSAGIGSIVGIIPGVGGEVAAFVTHAWFGRPARHRSEIDDRITGVVAAETSNNAKEGGALVPTLALGIPGSAGMAIMIGAFVLFGLQPGPSLMAEQTGLVVLLAFVLAFSNLIGSAAVLLFAPALLMLIRTPARTLVPIVVTLAVTGVIAYRGNTYDLVLAAAALALGVGLVRYGYSRAALLLGFILAPFVETYGAISYAAYGVSFLWRPSVLVLAAALCAFLVPWNSLLHRARGKP
jgi:TctA family transporter